MLIFLGIFAFSVVCVIAYFVIRGVWFATERTSIFVKGLVRSGVLAFMFTPTIYGHAGPAPAFLILLTTSDSMQWSHGGVPILIVWGVMFAIYLPWLLNHQRKSREPDISPKPDA